MKRGLIIVAAVFFLLLFVQNKSKSAKKNAYAYRYCTLDYRRTQYVRGSARFQKDPVQHGNSRVSSAVESRKPRANCVTPLVSRLDLTLDVIAKLGDATL